MTVDPNTFLAILAMAVATFATRVAGLWLMRWLRPGPIAQAALDATPVAVLTAVIAPAVVKGGVPDVIAAALCIAAACRLPLLATVIIGVLSAVGLRYWLG